MCSRIPVLLLLFSFPAAARSQDAAQFFDKTVAPLLSSRCLDCHDGPRPKGGLNLKERKKAVAGGKSGAVIVPGKPGESLLWEHISAGRMPPRKPLPESE